ncbi:polyprotein [Phytophthora megakarya]|uniref:Polyprotein n=1 Tax=Phytophthora megakarya TaxID=4795 RepID=A0A225VML6_9STRA|nr:polyprotein [Phytophthora megakarya]
MTTSEKKAEVIRGSDNYFHWEFAMRMMLARKGLLAHVRVVQDPASMIEAWLLNVMKALSLIAQGYFIAHHTKIRWATSVMQAWNTLLEFYNRTTMHNRVTMTRRLHEFKMEDGSTIARHLDKFGELIMGLQALEQQGRDPDRGEGEVTQGDKNGKFGKGGKGYDRKSNNGRILVGFKDKCFNFGKTGHIKRDCPVKVNGDSNDDSVFAIGEDRSTGWLINSGSTEHMTPHCDDLFEYSVMCVLDSDLKDRVYMEVPYGINNAMKMRVFVRIGFRNCGADECVYVKVKEGRYVYVCLYVDDMIIAAKTGEEIQEVKTALKNAFKMKELGEAKFILVMEIDHDYSAKMLAIRQTCCIDDAVNRFNQIDAKVVSNPCEAGLKLTKTQSPKTEVEFLLMQWKPYQALVGCLLYITTCIRPDVAYIVTQLSRFLENPGQQHWKAAIGVLRYLKGTREHGIVYNGIKGKVELSAYTDADWGSNLDDRRSVPGTMIMISGAPVIFKSKYQRTEVLWTRAMLMDMGHEQVGAAQVWEGNQENMAQDVIEVNYVPTKDQLADMLTMGLGTKRLQYLMDASGLLVKAVQH